MNQVFKIYLGIDVLLVIALICSGIMTSFIQVMHVQNLYDMYMDQIEYSDFEPEELEACFEDIEDKGAHARMTLYRSDGSLVECTCAKEVPADTLDVERVKFEFAYPYRIGKWASKKCIELVGYAE